MVIWWDKTNSGAWRLSAFVGEGAGEYLLTRTYFGYNKNTALKLFKAEIKREGARV